MEMIDRMEIVVEARLRNFKRRETAAVLQAALQQKDFEPGLGEIGAGD